MWYEYAIKDLPQNQIYQREDIVSILKKEKDGLSESSYIWIIGSLVRLGLLQHIGWNRYALADGSKRDAYTPLYSETAKDVRDKVEKKYPLIGFTVFESVLLNEFLNHQIAGNTIFVQVERGMGVFVFRFLRESMDGVVMYRPSRKEYSLYWQPGSVIILDWTSEAPLSKNFPHDITIEKLMVDIFCDRIIQLTYGGAEYKIVVETAYERYSIDTVRLLRYARRRHREKEITNFIPERQRFKEDAVKG